MLSSNKNKLDESMMFHRGVAGGVPDFKNLFSESPIHRVLFAYNRSHPTRAGAPHPPDVPLSVWYEAKGSKHVKGKVVMLTSNKNKLHELMMFHRGAAGGGSPPNFRNLFSESPIDLFFAYNRRMKQRVASM